MTKKLTHFGFCLLLVAFLFVTFVPVFVPVLAQETEKPNVMKRLYNTYNAIEPGQWMGGASAGGLPTYLGSIVRIFLTLLGVIFFALTVYGGFLWMYAGGNEESVKKAQSIIKQALIGLIITLLAGAITQFVIYWAGG